MTSRGTWPLSASDLVARARARRARPATRARQRRHEGRTWPPRLRAPPAERRAEAGRLAWSMAVDRVLLASPRGFCAGVEMAIKALAWMVRAFEPPVYCYHEIVHNKLVVDRFEALGRGVRRRHRRGARRRARSCCRPTARRPRWWPRPAASGSYVVDSVCPLVTKVHHEVKVRAGKGYRIVYVGHEGHEEAVGTMAVAPEHPPGRVGRRGRGAPALRPARRPAGPDHAVAPRLGRRRSTPPASASPSCGRRGAATCASPPPTASRR